MRVVEQSIEDSVGERGFADGSVPMVDGQLARDERRTGIHAVVEDLEQIVARRRVERMQPPIVELC